MKTRAALIVAVLGAAASASFGQVQTQGNVSYTLSSQIFGQGAGTPWSNPVPNGNGDANVDPGEGVLFKITINMSNAPGFASVLDGPLGAPQTWAPSIQAGSSGTGTNAGFWGGDLNLTGSGAGGGAGSWSDGTAAWGAAVRRRLITANAGGGVGILTANGNGLTDIQPAQFNGDAEGLNHTNNFLTFQALWIPGATVAGDVTFALGLGSLGQFSRIAASDSNYDNGYTLPVALQVTSSYAGAQTVHVVPTPASLALLGLGGLMAGRRRR